jgi:LPS export ABC transporter protein LptC
MARNGRWIGAVLAAAAVGVVVWALLRNPAAAPSPGRQPPVPQVTQTPAPRPAATPTVVVPQAVIKGTTISSVDERGRRQWEIQAASVVVDSASGTAALTTVAGTYFKEGQRAVSFTAPRGVFVIATRNVTLSARVRAQSTAGYILEADVVRWINRAQQIEASGAVVLHQKGLTIHADRLTADAALQRTRLEGRIRVIVRE